MNNGVKLFGEKKWDGAVAEFWAAYREKPVASPLINLALAYKQMKNSPKAIEVLELALAKHRDTMPESQIAAAEREVAEMKALLAWVTVETVPAHGVSLYVDGSLVPAEARGEAIALEPGTHSFRAEKKGYDSASAEVQVIAGRGNAPVRLELTQKDGRVRVIAIDADAQIKIDHQLEGRGSYDGMLPRGLHTVAILHDDEEQEIQIVVRPGGDHTVTQQRDGTLASPAAVKSKKGDDGDEFGPPKLLESLRGLYGYGSGALLTAFASVEGYTVSGTERWGAAGGIHVGYRVATWAGFEIWGQYSDIRLVGELAGEAGAKLPDVKMVLKSGRIGPAMRIWLPGRYWLRFVGTVGAGVLLEKLEWENAPPTPAYDTVDLGVGPYGAIDVGIEIEYSNVLFSLTVQNTIQSTKHFDTDAGGNAFDENPMLVHGPSLRIGYGLW
jgi:hypothetical protein